ncbi:MAG: hypothetical protein QM811_21030 [Pirellulales bacterium]
MNILRTIGLFITLLVVSSGLVAPLVVQFFKDHETSLPQATILVMHGFEIMNWFWFVSLPIGLVLIALPRSVTSCVRLPAWIEISALVLMALVVFLLLVVLCLPFVDVYNSIGGVKAKKK